jgi:hypothetical protein
MLQILALDGSFAIRLVALRCVSRVGPVQRGRDRLWSTWNAWLSGLGQLPGSGDGLFSLPAPVGVLDLSVNGTHWLRRTVGEFNTTGGNASMGTVPLINGDAHEDSIVDLFDLVLILLDFATAGPTGDGSVDLYELSIVLANFSMIDEP